MVLQNKYKAKASRRYNNSKATTDDAELGSSKPGSSKPGFRQRFTNKHRRPHATQLAQDGEEDGSDADSDDGDGEEGSLSGSDGEDDNTDFPSLAKAASTPNGTTAAPAKDNEDDPSNPNRGKYARHRLGESKLARLERLEAAKDPRLPDDQEPEPEVDISSLVARVAALGDSAATQAGLAEEIARSRAQHETASDVENDIDHSLAYLHEKERQRQKAKGRTTSHTSDSNHKVVADAVQVDVDGNPIDYEALKKEKEKAEAVRALKARFQGHDVGERSRSDAKPRAVPSIHIGPRKPVISAELVGSQANAAEGDLSQSLTVEIESSLAKSPRTTNGETSSVHSGRSSFSTTFGRRKSPLAGVSADSDSRKGANCGGSARRTERIDSFLASLNDRSVNPSHPSVFQLSPTGTPGAARPSPHPTSRISGSAERVTPQYKGIQSTPGELGRLESFLDDMLG
ncbi:hypothetical protein NDA13_003370 [Ustilago tritici]|nr:hypothetical protein NDA13_003370 [Ustilago tritici]